ncbi:transcription termination factor 4, mitochondrial [Halyomorpha halys]|uniref:transcription termination factor 4, mitochondrial n=1 Tax=Halyomorpha halys TaxID=286706 RepID=UPI0006D525BC|nr:transcription termination factor 4, mitochondrial-like [Halyomorpha halys]
MAHFRQIFRASYFLKNSCRYTSSIPHNVAEVVGTSHYLKYNYTVKEKLINLGLSNDIALKIASKPEFSTLNDKILDAPFEILGKCQFGSQSLTELIETHPLILLVDSKRLEKTCINLLSVFKKKYAYEILLKSPEVLNENWDSVCDKLKYLQEDMGVSNLDIVRHGILKHSLDQIKMRHELLKRTGKYKKLSPKLKLSDKHKLNPVINKVLNSPAEYFCTKVAEISELEFQVFQQLYNESEDSP